MSKSEILKDIEQAVINLDIEATKKLVSEALSEGLEPLMIIDQGLTAGISEIGKRFGAGECFLPELIVAAETMQTGLALVNPLLIHQAGHRASLGKVVIGTVANDVHDIGKNIVAAMLNAHGFEVVDLGVNVADDSFVEAVKQHQPVIVGLSALLTTTMAHQKSVIEALKFNGLRDKVKVIIGGAAVTPQWSVSIGADDYAVDAVEAVDKAKRLLA